MSHMHSDDLNSYTVAYWQANQHTLDAGGPFNIDDTAANISVALNALNGDANISQVIVMDNAAVTCRVAQLTSDAATLSKLINQNGSAATLNVKDTSAHIGNNFATIATEGQVATITVSDNAVVFLSGSQITNNASYLSLLVNANHTAAQVTAKDSAVNLAAALDTIQAHHDVVTLIVVSNSFAMTLTATQIANDTDALGEVTNNNGNAVSFKVSDTGANISLYLDQLQANSHISTITDNDNSAINLTIAQFTSDSSALGKVQNGDSSPVSFHVSDTAANISSAFNSLSGNSSVTKIVVTDSGSNEVIITVAQASSDTTALNELYQADGTSAAHVKVSDTAANISAAFDALNANTHVDKIAISPNGALTLTAGQVASDTTALGEIQGSYTIAVTDTAANISTNLNALQSNGHVTTITVSDNSEIVVSVAQLTSDATVIGELHNQDTSTVHVAVSDTAANIASALDSLNGNTQVNKIIVNNSGGNEVTISVAQAAADTTALGELYQSNGVLLANFAVSDTAANISAAFDALNGNARIDKIVVSDSATAQVTISAAQAASDHLALVHLVQANGQSAFAAVSDTATNISSAFDALSGNGNINKIIVNNSGSAEVKITVAQAAADTTALNELKQSNGTTAAHVAVQDTAANIQAAFDALNGNSHVDKIIVSDSGSSEVTITAAQAASDTAALNELYQANGTSTAHVAVSDTASNIQAAIDALNSNSHVDKIVVSNSGSAEVTISANQAANDTAALNELKQSDGSTAAHVAVSDLAANIASAFDALNSNTHVDKIIVSNSSSAEVTISVNQAATDTTALGELFLADGVTTAHVAVQDTAANIQGAFDALNGNSHVDKIIVSNSGSAEVTISVSQAASDTTALNELKQSDGTTAAHVAVSDVAANIQAAFNALNSNSHVDKIIVSNSASAEVTINVSQAASDTTALNELKQADGTTAAHVAVSDTAAAISAAFDALSGNGHVDKIVVSDSASNEVKITAAQAASDTTALNELKQSDGTTAALVAVQDTAANISSAFDALSSNAHVDRIIVSNSGSAEVTITAAQAASDTTALNELKQSDGSTAAHVAVSDTAAHISSAFDALNSNAHVDKIIVSDSGEVTINVTQVLSDTTALSELKQSDGTTQAKVAVSDTAAAISSNIDNLGLAQIDKIIVSNSPAEVTVSVSQLTSDAGTISKLVLADGTTAAHVAVSDTAASISTAFDSLNSNTHVDKIIVSNSPTQVTITAAQAASDTTALNELKQSDGSTAALVAVSDTATNISGAFDALNGNTHVNKIIVSNSGSAEVTITAAQAASDTTALNELKQSDGTTAAHVAVSDTAANIAGAFDALNGNTHVDKIIVSNSGGAEVTITAAQAASDTTALGELVQSDGTTAAKVAVQDTASAVSAAFDALNGNTHVDKIIVSNSGSAEVTITAAQAASDTTALNELKQSDGTTAAHVAVSDTASAISSEFNALNGNTHVDKIVVSDSGSGGEVTIAIAQMLDGNALGELYKADGTTPAQVAISDTAADISANFFALGAQQIDKVYIVPSGDLSLNASQVANGTSSLSKIQGSYSIDVTDNAAAITTNLDALQANGHVVSITVSDNAEIMVSIAQLSTDNTVIGELHNQDASTVHVIVSDTAADITGAIDSLNSKALVNKIIVNDSATHEVTITAAQAAADTVALGELRQANGTTPAQVAVSDSASSISSAFDALNGNTYVNKIIVSDSGTHEVTISVSQAASDTTALSELVQADGSTQAHVAVSDTAVSITNALDTLNTYGQVDKIIVSDDNAPTAFTEVRATVAQLTSDATALSELYYSDGSTPAKIAIYDTAADISAVLDTLNSNTQIDHIIISDNAAITVTAQEAVNDSVSLSELQNANGSPVTLGVLDTAANIATYLDQLNGESNISSIVISDNLALTLTAVQIGSDASALAKLANQDASGVQINVVDTAADISANLDALKANNDIVSITVSDNAPITVTVAQITSDAVILSELQNADHSQVFLTVKDTVANIRANLASLNQNTDITSIVISNNGVLLLSVAQLSADAHALSIMHNANGSAYVLRISDNSTNISAALDTLNTNSHVKTIVVTDNGAISLSIAQITSDATALSEVQNANATAYTLSVHDTAANVSSNFDALNNNAHVAKITVSDSASNEVTISATQFTADTTALGELFQANGTALAHVKVVDTASAVTTALDALSASSQVDKIVVSDSASHEVQVTIAQIASDATALAELYKADGTTPATVTVSDSASNVTTALDALHTNSQVDKIIVSDSAGHEVVVSIAQITSDANVLAELFKADGVTQATVTVSDTAANVTTALDTLNTNGQVDKIIVNDSATHEVLVSVAQITSDATALGELYQADGTIHAHIEVDDTASAISTAFNALSSNSQVNKIVVTDSGSHEVTLSATQIANDQTAINELFAADGTSAAHIMVQDTAAHISTNFDVLNSTSRVDKIIVTNSGSSEVTISIAQAAADTAALNELFLADGTTHAKIAISDTAANIAANLTSLQSASQVDHIFISDGNPLVLSASLTVNDTAGLAKIVGAYSINVLDTGARISANLDALEANPNVTLVTVSDNKVVTISIAQLTSDANVLGVMVDASTGTAAALKVLDTAANIQANLGNLKADLSVYNFTLVTISDNQAITLTAAQFAADSAVLADLRNADKSPVNLIVSDTAAHLQASIDAFQAYNTANPLSKISSIVVTNSAALTLSIAQLTTDAQVLAEVTNRNGSTVSFKIADSAAHISTSLNQLQNNGHISFITVLDNAAIALSIAQLSSDASILSKLHNADSSAYTLNVTDTASNISAALASLNGNTHVTKVIVSDSATHEVHATVAQLGADTTLFSELYQADGVSHAHVTLADTSVHIDALSTSAIATLATEGVDTIDATNNKVLINLAQYEAFTNNAMKLTAGDAVTVTDTASAFAAATTAELSALGTNNVDKVVLTGTGEFALDHWAALTGSGAAITTTGATITIDGTSSNDTIATAGTGSFTLNGGAGADVFTVNAAAHDVFVYGAASESSGSSYDTITGYNTATDLFHVANAVTGIDTQVTGVLDSGANFDTEMAAAIGSGQLGADHAVLFKVTSGSLAGHTFLIVDENGVAGYQSGGDLVIDVTGGLHLTSLNTGDFTSST